MTSVVPQGPESPNPTPPKGGFNKPDAGKTNGFWLVYHSDWSGVAVFQQDEELNALRYANMNYMTCEFREWGVVR